MTGSIPRSAIFADRRRIDDIAESTPGLPVPALTAALAVFDYRSISHAEVAREAVAHAVTALSDALDVTFSPAKEETAGDFTPRYVREAWLASGLKVVIISRVDTAGDGDGTGAQVPELASVA
jgi:hypothetical protein